MTAYNRETQVNIIIHFFIVPFIITIISSVGICIIHCNCSCKKERPKYRRPRIDNLRWAFGFFFVCVLVQCYTFFFAAAKLWENYLAFLSSSNVAVTLTITFAAYWLYFLFTIAAARSWILLVSGDWELFVGESFLIMLVVGSRYSMRYGLATSYRHSIVSRKDFPSSTKTSIVVTYCSSKKTSIVPSTSVKKTSVISQAVTI